MNSYSDNLIGFLLALAVLATPCVIAWRAADLVESTYRKEAVELGHAYWKLNTDGSTTWHWKREKKEDE